MIPLRFGGSKTDERLINALVPQWIRRWHSKVNWAYQTECCLRIETGCLTGDRVVISMDKR